MLSVMVNPFKKPYKNFGTPRDKFISILIFGLFIFLFLYLFKPFGITQLQPVPQFFVTLGFGLITTFVLFVFNYLVEPVLIKGNWTLGKRILWDVVIASSIGCANYLYISIIIPHTFRFEYLFISVWTAILVGSIPVTIGYIVRSNRLYKAALKDASIPIEEILWESEVLIRAGNPKNEYRFNPKSIVYLCSNDNYVTVVTIRGDTLTKTHLRGTLKAAELELIRNTCFLRCHKCYIINTEFIDRIIGNSQNMKIKLLPSGTEIPVSRSKAAMVLRKIK